MYVAILTVNSEIFARMEKHAENNNNNKSKGFWFCVTEVIAKDT